MLTKQRSLTGPLGPALIGEMGQWLQALGAEFNFSPEDQYRIDLCGEEIVTNIVKYSDPQYANQPVELRAVIEPQRARLIFIDPAGPFDPFSRPPPAAVTTLENFAIGGQGVHLVREFTDAHRYERRDLRNWVELDFALTQETMRPPASGDMPSDGITNRPDEDQDAVVLACQAQIFQGVRRSAIEGLLEPLAIQDICGETILLKPGDANDSVRLVLRGRLRICLDKPGIGDFIEAGFGACVGEMSVIDERPASAYVVAEAGVRLMIIDAETFLHQVLALPRVSRNLFSIMAERMRRSDELTIKRVRKALQMEQVERELKYAHSIQEGLLPKDSSFSTDARLDSMGRMIPARDVGGDFYDIFFLDTNHVFFVIADVCGKGLPAALFMVRAISILRAQSGFESQSADYAAHLIERLNQQLCAYNDAQQFLTAFCGVLDLETLTLCYVNAGHNPPAVAVGREAFQYLAEPINPFVGMVDGLAYRAGTVMLQPGSVLLLYTDGVTEAEDMEVNMFGDDRLLDRLNAAPSRTARELVDAVFADVRDFVAEAPQSDDITVLAVVCSELTN